MSSVVLSTVEGDVLNTKSLIGAALLAVTVAHPAHAQAPDRVAVAPAHIEPGYKESADLAYLRYQMRKHPNLPPVDFWMAVAFCETHREWDRGHAWRNAPVSGGLGIANTTWQGYGGQAFAPKAAKASKYAQMVVANRIGFLGFQTRNVFMTFEDRVNNKPFYRPAAGFGKGWGGTCRTQWIKNNGGKP